MRFICSLAFGLALTTIASAHSWYPMQCCHDQDCHPVACDEISETKDGAEWNRFKFRKDQIHPSQDSKCHVCIGHGEYPYCIFMQQNF